MMPGYWLVSVVWVPSVPWHCWLDNRKDIRPCATYLQRFCWRTSRRRKLRETSWHTPFTRYYQLSNRFDNRLDVCLHDTAGCQTGCQTGLTTGWLFVYTIQPIVKPVWQQVVSC